MKSFAELIAALIELYLTLSAMDKAAASRKYIRDQVFVYNSNVEASGYYKQAANIQAAQNAVVSGCVALSTMYIGGLIMGGLARMANVGIAVEGVAATKPFLAIRGVTVLPRVGGTLPGMTMLETTAMEVGIGLACRGTLGALGMVVVSSYTGKMHWKDTAKLAPLSAGGLLRAGPALGFLLGALISKENAALREKYEKEITHVSIKELIANHSEKYARQLDSRINSSGKYAKLLYATPSQLESKIQQPMRREVDKITNKIVKKETGMFGGPKRGDVYASVYGQFGAGIWAPIASHTGRAFINLQMDVKKAKAKLDKAFLKWSKE